MNKLKNPKSFIARFFMNFILFYSAAIVVMATVYLMDKWDPFMGWIAPLALSVCLALVRAAISKPDTPFMSSPIMVSGKH